MPTLPCPSCRRLLQRPDHLRDALVQCPACGTTFAAPAEDQPVPVPPPQSTLPPVTPPAPAPEPEHQREFHELVEKQPLRYRNQAALKSAVAWMRGALLLDAVLSVVCYCPSLLITSEVHDPDDFTAVFLLGFAELFFTYLPLLFVGFGVYHLQVKRSYGLALGGAILLLPVSLWNFLHAGYLLLQALGQVSYGYPGPCFQLFCGLLGLVGTVAGLIGGIKGIAVLSDAEVRNQFR